MVSEEEFEKARRVVRVYVKLAERLAKWYVKKIEDIENECPEKD